MLPKILVVASSAIAALLGCIHLLYTFTGTKLSPRDPAVQAAMSATPIRITSETNVWNAWLGFNASHSMCLILFGLVYGYLAVKHPEVLHRSIYLQAVGLAVLAAFVALAKLYWFSIPLVGISIALGLYVAGLAAARVAAPG